MEGRSAALLQTNTPTLKGGWDWLGRHRDVVTCSPRIPSLAKTLTSVLRESHNLLLFALPSHRQERLAPQSPSPGVIYNTVFSLSTVDFFRSPGIFPAHSRSCVAAALGTTFWPAFRTWDGSGHAVIAVQPIPLYPPANLKPSRLPLRRVTPFHPATTLDPHRQSRSSAAFNPENGKKQHQQRGFV
jgi:hypothetical protein